MSVEQKYHKQVRETLGKIGKVRTTGSKKPDGSVEGFAVSKAEIDAGQIRALAELTERIPIGMAIKRSGANLTISVT